MGTWKFINKYSKQWKNYRVCEYGRYPNIVWLAWHERKKSFTDHPAATKFMDGEIIGRSTDEFEAKEFCYQHARKVNNLKQEKKREKPAPSRIEVEAVALKELSNMRELLL